MSALFSPTALVVPFENLRMSDVESVGGKNASLGEMISQLPQGVRVPTGFATTAHAFRDGPSQAVHIALVRGQWQEGDSVPVRVHEPLSVLDALEVNRAMHSWGLDTSLQYIASQERGVAVLLNCGESAEQLLAQFDGTARAAHAPERGRMDLRTYAGTHFAPGVNIK